MIERDIQAKLLEAVKSEIHHHEVHEPKTPHIAVAGRRCCRGKIV